MLASSYELTKYLHQHKTDFILHAGIGGILDRSSRIGKVYQVHIDEIFGFGAEDNGSFIPIETLGFGKRTYTESLPRNLKLPQISKANGITVNTVHGSRESIDYLRRHYPHSLVESMEGAAVFFVAEREGVHCIQLRAISNYIEPRNKDKWNIGLAVQNLNDVLKEFLTSLEPYS